MGFNYKRLISLLTIFMFILPDFANATTLEAWVAPSNISLTVKSGESGSFDLLATTGTPPIKKLDVVFAIDRTGSMSGEIDQIKNTAINIMNNVKSKVPDSQFGVMTFQDYPGTYSYSGYTSTYGGSTDKPYEMLQTVTDNSASVTSAISSIYASGGADGPEAYTRVLYETGNGTPSWRADSKKVVILLGDAPTHDEDFAGLNYGGDPGPDCIANTADDLNFEDVVQSLKDKKITVLAIQARSDSSATATFKGASIGYGTAAGTDGQYYAITDTTQITTEIMKMVTEEVLNIKEMSLSVPDQYKSWFTTNPGNYLDVGPSTSNSFNVTISVPAGTPEGQYSFPINVLGDGSVLSTANVKINVTPGTVTGSGVLEIASADYGALENGGAVSVTINRSGGNTGEVSVNYTTSDNTAKATQDYTETKGTVTFKDGEVSKTISVPILDNTTINADKSFYFKINSPTGGATLGSVISSKITIADNEEAKPGVLGFGSFNYNVTSNIDKAEITVNRTDGSDGTVTVDYATSDGTATAGNEYTAVSGSLTFNSGETTKSFYVPINKAAVFSGSKAFNVTLSNATNGAMLGAESTTVVNVQFVPTVSSISVNPTTASVLQGATQQLTVTGIMSDGSTKDVTNSIQGTTYTSSNTSVATVDENGLVTVLPTATIGYKTLVTAKNNGMITSCTLTVGTNAVPTPSSISIDPTTVTLGQGDTQQLIVTGTMPDGSTKDVTNSSEGTTYTSSNTSVATVDANGLVTVLPTATIGYKTVITAKNNGITANCTVTVGTTAGPKPSSISVNPTTVTLGQGDTQQLIVTGTMSDGSTADVTNSSQGTTYTSSNTSVATVDENGLVTVLPTATVGYKTLITAKNNGITASCTVTVGTNVGPKPSSISVNPTTATVGLGGTQQLTVTGNMADGTTKDVTNSSEGTTYTSSNTSVATVDTNGLVTVLPTATVGYKTVITAKNNGINASCTITVGTAAGTKPSVLSINPTSATVGKGATKQLTVTGTMPDGSTADLTSGSQGTTYVSSNTSVATVDANGLVTVLSTATVGYKTLITAKNNGINVSCTITAGSAVGTTTNSLSVNPTTATVGKGTTKQLAVTANMSDGTTTDVTNSSEGTTYVSSNTSVATVDANGLVTVLPTATVGYKSLITAKNGTKSVSCTITAGTSGTTVNSISSNLSTVTLGKGATQQLIINATLADGTTKDVTNSSEGTTYTSSNTTVATVDANGLITVLPTATIGYKTVITAKNSGKSVSCTVTVGTTGLTISSLSINPTTATVGQGATQQLIVTGTMSDGSTKDVTSSSEGTTYTSSNTSVATVDANGLITVLPTAISGYKTVITAKNGTKSVSCTITAGVSGTTVSSISANLSAVTLARGATQQLIVTATMSDGSTLDVTNSIKGTTYASSNTSVATVDANGLITILPTATVGYKSSITIKNNSKIFTCTVTVGP